MTKCPVCEKGTLKKANEKHVLFGVELGTHPGEKCSNCNEVFTDSSVIKVIEEKAKEEGIWGLARKTTIAKTGNSLAVRIPKEMADFLKLKEGTPAYLHPEKNKLVIEML